MGDTNTRYTRAGDTIGRFAEHENSEPELSLTEHYLDDDSDGSDFDIHDFYDATGPAPADGDEDAYSAWLEEQRTPQGIDEHFDRPDPTLADIPAAEQITIGAWGSAKPF